MHRSRGGSAGPCLHSGHDDALRALVQQGPLRRARGEGHVLCAQGERDLGPRGAGQAAGDEGARQVAAVLPPGHDHAHRGRGGQLLLHDLRGQEWRGSQRVVPPAPDLGHDRAQELPTEGGGAQGHAARQAQASEALGGAELASRDGPACEGADQPRGEPLAGADGSAEVVRQATRVEEAAQGLGQRQARARGERVARQARGAHQGRGLCLRRPQGHVRDQRGGRCGAHCPVPLRGR